MKHNAGIFLMMLFAAMVLVTNTGHAQHKEKICGKDCSCRANNHGECACGANCKCATQQSSKHGTHTVVSNNTFLAMMDTMMVKMDAAPLSAANERNFLLQMIPHHQGAVDMAKYEMAHGKNNEMIQLAKSILAEQQGEIMEMQAMLGMYPLQQEAVSPMYKSAMDKTMVVMMNNTPTDSQLSDDVDCNFAMVMLPHHQAAVDMAIALLKLKPAGQINTYVQRIISDQQIEIEQMQLFINNHCKHSH